MSTKPTKQPLTQQERGRNLILLAVVVGVIWGLMQIAGPSGSSGGGGGSIPTLYDDSNGCVEAWQVYAQSNPILNEQQYVDQCNAGDNQLNNEVSGVGGP